MTYFLYRDRTHHDLAMTTSDRALAERLAHSRGLHVFEPGTGKIARPHWHGQPCPTCRRRYIPRVKDGTIPAHYGPDGGREADRCPGEGMAPAALTGGAR